MVRHRIVVATCTTSGGIYKLGLSEGHFTHCFIDEAGETTEPESMIPIGKMHALKNVQFHEIYVTKIMNKTSRKNFFDQNPFFAILKMAKNQFLNWENCQKCNFMRNKF